MLLNRHRGLADLHHAVASLLVALLFWLYAELTILALSDYMRLTREVALLPYFLSLVIGLLFAWKPLSRRSGRLTALRPAEALALATRQVGLVALVVFAMMFATQDRSISRLFLGSFLGWAWLLLALLHRSLPRRLAGLAYGGDSRVGTVFVSRAAAIEGIEPWVRARTHLGLEPRGILTWEPASSGPRPGWLGLADELGPLLARERIGQVILWEPPPEPAAGRRVVEACQAAGARLLLRDDSDSRLGHPVVPVDLEGEPFFTLHDEPLEEPINRALKRAFDIVVALPVVILALPPLALLVWAVQRRQSPGPLFHTRARSGEGRAPFAMLKFRTMHLAPADAAAEASQASRDDGRIYPFGHFLRRHSLDEFPQFWNVLIGEMSVVGPRPVMPLLDEEFERQARAYRTRHLVKPGVTGLAQSQGFRGEITTSEQLQGRVRRDLHYIAEWSLWLDVQITARTLWQVFFPPSSAY